MRITDMKIMVTVQSPTYQASRWYSVMAPARSAGERVMTSQNGHWHKQWDSHLALCQLGMSS